MDNERKMRKLALVGMGVLVLLSALVIFSFTSTYAVNITDYLPQLSISTQQEDCQRLGCFRYAVAAKPFAISPTLLTSMEIPPKKYADLTTNTLRRFVAVTGASSDHFHESVDGVASMQTNMPGRKIIYYDLGLTPVEVAEVKTWCSVEYREYNTTAFPSFVKTLIYYAWKPIIIQEVLREYPAVFWMDSSFRWMTQNMTQLYERARYSDGFVLFGGTGHSNFAVTHSGMLRYLPTNITEQKQIDQFGATAAFVVNTRSNFDHVLLWYYLCALTEDCIAPMKNRFCHFASYRYGKFAKCHRFDQSLANILLSKRWHYNTTRYTMVGSDFKIIRETTSYFKVKICKKGITQTKKDRTFNQ